MSQRSDYSFQARIAKYQCLRTPPSVARISQPENWNRSFRRISRKFIWRPFVRTVALTALGGCRRRQSEPVSVYPNIIQRKERSASPADEDRSHRSVSRTTRKRLKSLFTGRTRFTSKIRGTGTFFGARVLLSITVFRPKNKPLPDLRTPYRFEHGFLR
jgi:hypothetical protein